MKALFHNAYDVVCRDGKWIPIRFTSDQLTALGKIHSMYERLGRCTSGVTLQFRTTAETISFRYELGGFYTSVGGFDVYENGVLCANFPLPAEPCADIFTYTKTSPGETLFEIALPYHAECSLSDFELGEYQTVAPSDGPFALFYGDSLTQSAYTATPSISFPRLFSKLCRGRYINRGVGSLFFDASVLDADDTCRPDLIFVKFGANDIVMRDENNNVVIVDGKAQYYGEEQLPWLLSRAEAYFDRLTEIYPDAQIIAITQPWNNQNSPAHIAFMREAMRAGTEEICRERGLRCIDGRTLFPHLPECLAADAIHLNALGGSMTAQALYNQVRDLL